jgi:outer membrane lipoprotein SlyB
MRVRSTDRGQAVPLLLIAVALGALAIIGIADLAAGALDSARARSAADAAALAGALDGAPAAQRLAQANGAQVVLFGRDGDQVLVVVKVGRATARARATLDVAVPRP